MNSGSPMECIFYTSISGPILILQYQIEYWLINQKYCIYPSQNPLPYTRSGVFSDGMLENDQVLLGDHTLMDRGTVDHTYVIPKQKIWTIDGRTDHA